MIKAKRFSVLILSIILVFSLHINVLAEELTQQEQVTPEQPSLWAMEGVEWSAIYGLANQEMYKEYESKVTREELYAVGINLYESITGTAITPVEKSPFSDTESPVILRACAINILPEADTFEPLKEATRLDMITALYDVIRAAKPDFDFASDIEIKHKDVSDLTQESLEIVKYAVAKQIVNGRLDNTLGLGDSCTRQELLVFASKIYDFVIYESGEDSKGVFWSVSDEDSKVYLLGSVHLASPTMYPLSKAMLNAFGESDALVVEANIANQAEGMEYLQQKMMYMDENTLEQNIPKEMYNQVVQALSIMGIPPEICNKLKPWSAAMMLQNAQLVQGTYSAGLGIDLFFTIKATGTKEIVEIEGIKFQVDMFDSFSQELQTLFLASVLNPGKRAAEEGMELLDSMIEAWKDGNFEDLQKLMSSKEDNSAEMKEFNEKMWTTRNHNMTEKVRSYLDDPEQKTYFIVVGAGHMGGDSGIVTQLIDEYKIEQIK